MFVYGTQFYRPPNPPRSQRREALVQIAEELGFNTIKIWVMWNWCNPQPDVYDFDEVEEIMTLCDELGLRVVVNTILETAPYWLDERYPDARYVNASGQALLPRGRSSDPNGGWPGLCFDHPVVTEAAAEFLQAVAETVRSHSSMFTYDCWNEPHIEPAWFNSMWPTPEQMIFCYCDSTQARFRDWLQRKYKAVDTLNNAWVRKFRDWGDVLPPQTHGTYADWMDWRRFIIDSMTAQMRFRAEALRAADPDHPIMSHGAKFPPLDAVSLTAVNNWDLVEPLDAWGCALFPKWHRMSPALMAGKFDACRSNARGKPWWLAELQGGHGMVTGLRRGAHVYPRDVRLWNWLAIAAGSKGIVYWAYMAEATGLEASGFGLVDRGRNLTQRAEAAARNHALIQEYAHIFEAYQPVPQVGVLYDQDNAILAFAMDGNENPATGSALGYYQAVWKGDVWARFIQLDEIDALWPDIKVLLAPWHLVGKAETMAALRGFVNHGGVLISDTGLGLYDQNGVHNPIVPPLELSESCGIRELESHWLPEEAQPATIWERMAPLSAPAGVDATPLDELYRSPVINLTQPVVSEIRARVFLTPLAVTAPAQVIATYGDAPVAARTTWGEGTVYYFGTNLGACIHYGDEDALRVVHKIIADHTTPAVRGERLRPRLVEGDGEALLVVVNQDNEPHTESIALPEKYQRATDIHTERLISIQDGVLQVSVGAQDVQVIHLQARER